MCHLFSHKFVSGAKSFVLWKVNIDSDNDNYLVLVSLLDSLPLSISVEHFLYA